MPLPFTQEDFLVKLIKQPYVATVSKLSIEMKSERHNDVPLRCCVYKSGHYFIKRTS